MTKTELKKLQTKSVIKMLIEEYNAYHIYDEMGGRIAFNIDTHSGDTLQCEYHRSNQDVAIYENVKLSGDGWTEEDKRKAMEAKILEGELQGKIDGVLKEICLPQ
jgi:hypothetical protein